MLIDGLKFAAETKHSVCSVLINIYSITNLLKRIKITKHRCALPEEDKLCRNMLEFY
jgi:hypothetical protein